MGWVGEKLLLITLKVTFKLEKISPSKKLKTRQGTGTLDNTFKETWTSPDEMAQILQRKASKQTQA